MLSIDYHEPLFRPPAEADSLIFQVAYGCPHNTCTFCLMYKSVRYRLRDQRELFREIEQAGCAYPRTQRIFLADGDVMRLDFDYLREVLEHLERHFPRLARVSLYANGSSLDAKSDAQWAALKKRKLHTLYLGLETGDDALLRLVHKQEDVLTMVRAVTRAQALGLRCSVMVLLGLGGRARTAAHSAATATALNRMQPRLLSFLRFIELPGARMFPGYTGLTEREAVLELRDMLSRLSLQRTVVRANHSSNPVPLEGRLDQDRTRLLSEIDTLLLAGRLDDRGPGSLPCRL